MAKRLTRKEIVQVDRVQATLTAIYAWANHNRNLLLTVLGVFLITLVLSYVWQQHQRGQDQLLQARFGEALERYREAIGEAPLPVGPDQTEGSDRRQDDDSEEARRQQLEEVEGLFSSLVDEYPSASLGLLSRYYRALVLQQLGQVEEAEQDLSAVVAESSQGEIRNLARRVLAQLAQKDDVEQATVFLEAIVNESSDPFPRDGVLMQIARNHEQIGNQTEALGYYKRLAAEYPSSELLSLARSRIAQLDPEGESGTNGDAAGENQPPQP